MHIILYYDARPWQQAIAPRQVHCHKGKQLIHLQQFSTNTNTVFITFSTAFNKLHKIVNTLFKPLY